jgi:hypothetical protein
MALRADRGTRWHALRFACLSLAVWIGQAASLFGQGQILFNNRVESTVVAPVYGPERSSAFDIRQGNAASGFPVGSQIYLGEPLAGPGFTAQLFGGRPATPPTELKPLDPSSFFLDGEREGFLVEPPHSITVPDVATGEPALIQLRVWDNRGGTVTNWQQVLNAPSILRGQSRPFLSLPLGGLFQAPPNLIGLESFNLTPGQPEMFALKGALESGMPRLRFSTKPGYAYEILGSTNLTDWIPFVSPPPVDHWVDCVVTNSLESSTWFFRVRGRAQ